VATQEDIIILFDNFICNIFLQMHVLLKGDSAHGGFLFFAIDEQGLFGRKYKIIHIQIPATTNKVEL
jgi:hypothetical protein